MGWFNGRSVGQMYAQFYCIIKKLPNLAKEREKEIYRAIHTREKKMECASVFKSYLKMKISVYIDEMNEVESEESKWSSW